MKKILTITIVFMLAQAHPAAAAERIAFSRLIDGYWQIWTMNTDGQDQKQVTQSPIDKRDPVWIKTGQAIAFRSNNGQLFTVDLATHEEEELLQRFNNINNPHYCSATDDVVFVRFDPRATDASSIWKSSVTGEDPVVLTQDSILKYQPVFSSKCDQIAFVKADIKTKNHHLWLMPVDGSALTQLTHGQGLFTLPSFSPDDRFITFTSNTEDNNYEIYLLDLATFKITRVTRNPGLDTYSRFSPDGTKLIFVSSRSGNQQIWVMDKDGSNARQITSGDAESVSPAWGEIKEQGI